MLFFKTKNYTLSAKRWESGLSMGIYGSQSVCSLEERNDGSVVLLVNDDVCGERGIEIIHTNADWEYEKKGEPK